MPYYPMATVRFEVKDDDVDKNVTELSAWSGRSATTLRFRNDQIGDLIRALKKRQKELLQRQIDKID